MVPVVADLTICFISSKARSYKKQASDDDSQDND